MAPSLEDMHADYKRAFAAYMGLLKALPVWRNLEQQEQLSDAGAACDRAKWIYDKAKYQAERRSA